jgi:hypothetical protein
MFSVQVRFTKELSMKSGILTLLFFSLSWQAQAFMTVQESNEVTPAGKFKVGLEPQLRTSNGSGGNFTGFFDAPINEELSTRAVLGTGDMDFVAGGSLKWVPVPDYGNQPSLGGKFGAYYTREANENLWFFRVEPILSKKLPSEIGTFIPYASVPLIFNNSTESNETGIQLAVGSEYWNHVADNMTFGAEVGFDVKDSFSYISGYVTIFLDDTRPK